MTAKPAMVSDDQDSPQWIRKSRSTSKKRHHQRRQNRRQRPSARPQTAPVESEPRRRSHSSSSVSNSPRSPASGESREYIPSREESSQPSRSCRSLKKKRLQQQPQVQKRIPTEELDSSAAVSSDAEKVRPTGSEEASPNMKNQQILSVTHLDLIPDEDDDCVGKSQTLSPPDAANRIVVTDTEVTAPQPTISAVSHIQLTDEDQSGIHVQKNIEETFAQNDQVYSTPAEKIRWRPGSLIPPRITAPIFGPVLFLFFN